MMQYLDQISTIGHEMQVKFDVSIILPKGKVKHLSANASGISLWDPD